jgi:nucleotide-binding universal stress UspA family protein
MTAASAGAVRAGIDMARRSGASLVVLSVIDASHLRLPGGLFQRRVDQVRAERESALVGVVADARGLGVAAQFLIWEGDPGPSLVDAAEAENADIIVVGSRGRGSIGRLLLGSVSSYVVANARKPVVVIRPGWRPDDASTLEPMTRMKRARAADPGSRS